MILPAVHVWPQDVTQRFTEAWDVGTTETSAAVDSGMRSRLDFLHLGATLGAEIVGGLASIKGSFAITLEEKRTRESQRLLFHTRQLRRGERVTEELLERCLPVDDGVFKSGATHFVAKVLHGADAMMGIEIDKSDIKDLVDIESELALSISLVLISGNGKFDIGFERKVQTVLNRSTIVMHSDVSFGEQVLDVQGAQMALNGLQAKIDDTNGGKGIPKIALLAPLDDIACPEAGYSPVLFREVSESGIQAALNHFIRLREAKAAMERVEQDLGEAGLLTWAQLMREMIGSLSAFQSRSQQRFQKLLPRLRDPADIGLSSDALLDFVRQLELSPFGGPALEAVQELARRARDDFVRFHEQINSMASSNTIEVETQALRRALESKRARVLRINGTEAAEKVETEPGVVTANDVLVKRVDVIRSITELDVLLTNPNHSSVLIAVFHGISSAALRQRAEQMKAFLSSAAEPSAWATADDEVHKLETFQVTATRSAASLMAHVAAPVPSGRSCHVPHCESQPLVVLDAESFGSRFHSRESLDKTRVALFVEGAMVNSDVQLCPSPDDPRDDVGGCLWTGQNDIPDGFRCAAGFAQGGCQGWCSRRGTCGPVPCHRFHSTSSPNDWFLLRPDPAATVGLVDCAIWDAGAQGELRLAQCEEQVQTHKWTWGREASGYDRIHPLANLALCLHGDPVIRSISVRRCVPGSPYQAWQRSWDEFSMPHLAMANAALCLHTDVTTMGVSLRTCVDQAPEQTWIESFQLMNDLGQCIVPETWIDDQTSWSALRFRDCRSSLQTHFYWNRGRLMLWTLPRLEDHFSLVQGHRLQEVVVSAPHELVVHKGVHVDTFERMENKILLRSSGVFAGVDQLCLTKDGCPWRGTRKPCKGASKTSTRAT
ncbi:Stonustoxin subunit alpha [Durusdinium trenchii]|uniref:Stonustoxin subunit alpha n=1 Tax=Durusdinium trenchii TaxID=1381693 RepID=A0ABP0HXJ0_9DINO